MEICNPNLCTGCNACANICPQKCITLQENRYGELHPKIDEEKCLKCNLCIKTCPNNKTIARNYPIKCFASWITNNEKRKRCASGGIGTAMSEYVISKKKGVVFGTKYNETMTPVVTKGTNLNDIENFKGSKYVQSIIANNTFAEVKLLLKTGVFVLYIGTPCQIAGLKSYLNKEYDNLITADLICHGVSPTKYLKEEIECLCNRNNIEMNHITDIRFRGNDGNDRYFTLWKETQLLYKRLFNCSCYFSGFTYGITLRENCHNCKYATPERVSDITIGDFIGLEKNSSFPYPTDNVSAVMINTPKGEGFYREVTENASSLINIERDYNERLAYGPSLRHPFKKHKLRPLFRSLYIRYGYVKAIHITMNILTLKTYIKEKQNAWKYLLKSKFNR